MSGKTMMCREGGQDSRRNPLQRPREDKLKILNYSELIHFALLAKGLPGRVDLAL